jgi:hypothetical protein
MIFVGLAQTLGLKESRADGKASSWKYGGSYQGKREMLAG